MPTCPICGNYDWIGNHKCPPKWLCSDDQEFERDERPDADYMQENGHAIFATDAEKAAISFAEYYQAREAFYPDEMTVFVMDESREKIWKYIVDRETVPSYSVGWNYKPEVYPCSPVGEEVEP